MKRFQSLSHNQMFGLLFGGVYLVIGVGGFAVTEGLSAAETRGGLELGLFSVNPLHNIAHLAIGAVLFLGAVAGLRASRSVNLAVGVAYLGLAAAGPFLVGTDANILALNGADHLLHLGTGLVAMLVAIVLGRRDAADAGSPVSPHHDEHLPARAA